MSTTTGKVGQWELEFKSAPRGAEGEIDVLVCGKPLHVRWRSDAHGIWIETPHEVVGYDLEGERDEDGSVRFKLLRRGGIGEFAGLAFKRSGEIEASSAPGAKKSVRVRAQMPGKIVRVMVKAGEEVRKGDALMVMEAMKMENEIRALHGGTVKTVHVTAGQAVETGAELISMEGA